MPRWSSHTLGKYEAPIIDKVSKYLEKDGFTVYPHAALNMVYGHNDTDVDVLGVKNGEITAIEVKSSHDNPRKALEQGKKMTGLVDHYYLAIEKPIKFDFPWGIMMVKDDVVIIKEAENCLNISMSSLMYLLKPCLNKISGTKIGDKNRLVHEIYPQLNRKLPLIRKALLCSKSPYNSMDGKKGDTCKNCPIGPLYEKVPEYKQSRLEG